MITQETRAEIRNMIVTANMALHRGDIGRLYELLNKATHRVKSLNLCDIEVGRSLSMLDTHGADRD